MESYVQLERQFSPVPKSQEEAESDEILSIWGHVRPKVWDDLDSEFRCVILAEAGAGKTEELRQRARALTNNGEAAFFIRIEDIEADFHKAFEIGSEAQFQSWLQSTKEAWFFLDSVDEARLENPRAFEKALRRFAISIEGRAHRAHIYLSSRPYAWRPIEDRKLLDELLFFPTPQGGEGDKEVQGAEPQSTLTIYTMRPLDKDRVRRFCLAREAKEVDQLLHDIERADLWSLAERPFDLEGILIKWADDNVLSGRMGLLHHNIDKRLRDDHSSDRALRQPLNLERARDGARRLAAAVLLTGRAGLNVPDAVPIKPGIEAESVLADWDPKDVRALLERGIFNDIIYGAVRFRHRDVRELLAAEWFEELLKTGNSRHSVEALFFREHYGEKLVTPRLRPVLPWLILLDDEVRRRALEIHPEIAVEGGDPSRLPLLVRRRILTDIVRRIVSNEDDRTARDNSAIARIANQDLSEDVQQLIRDYGDNDDATFFLGRLVWQGEMENCVAPFVDIALDSSRGIYARIASARAVMTCGSIVQYQSMWQKLNESDAQIPQNLLAELVEETKPDSHSVEYLVASLSKLPPYKRHQINSLGSALHEFVERLPTGNSQEEIAKLLDGLSNYLDMQPYIERRECHISENYAWLLSPALYAIERLIGVRSAVVFCKSVQSILLMAPALRHYAEYDLGEHKHSLQKLIPDWPALNDALYWASIEQARAVKAKNSSEPLSDDWSISWLGHYWSFDMASLPRLLGYMRSRELQVDRLVALSTAFRVYVQAGRPTQILSNLQDAVTGDFALQQQLDFLLNPPVSEEMQRLEEEHEEHLRKQNLVEMQNKQARETWIAELRANPDRVRNSPNLKPDEFTDDQYWLMRELLDHHLATNRLSYANWPALIPSFGDNVARAYRDAAVNRWRYYVPPLKSEGAHSDNQISNILIFAMAGLEIEAAESTDFPRNLNESQVRHALRYITWESNGFPSWFERVYRAFPDLVKVAVLQELVWELENSVPEKPMHYILSDVVYHAPWLHHAIAPDLLKWVKANPQQTDANRHYCLQILANGGIDSTKLASLASQQIELVNGLDSISWWYALRVNCDPASGIPEVGQWLSDLNEDEATHAAQIFVTALMGGRHMNESGPNIGNFRTVEYLKSLYILMHRYIRVKEDINRGDGGVYSPGLRDDAQDARNRLFSLLSEIPGKGSYSAIKQLIREHPEPDYRPWMIRRAYKKAEEDGDLEPWTAKQVGIFHITQTIAPETHRQLFDLTIHRLHDLKNWVERGNDSPWETWQRANSETEMRNLIAGWLNQQSREQYTTAQEPELANSQRMDIWLHNTNVKSPVPIELKLLDKGWSGPNLCERLRNQLVGDYLREESAGCGVMLLVSQKIDSKKRWKIDNRLVGLNKLAMALKLYWRGIADEFAGVEEVDVIVIDLAIREKISNT